jgi:glycosyltransferase involved in cell wall biosynthesis
MDTLFITRKWPPAVGGMETYCVELCERLAHSVDLRVEALRGRADGSTPTAVSLIGFGLRTAWRLLTSAARFDVAHGSDMAIWPLIWLAGVRRPGARLVLSAHGTDVSLGTRRGAVASAYGAYLRLSARLLSRATVLANSEATAALVRRFGFSNIRVVRLAASQIADGAPDLSEPYVLFVGRLTASKGCGWFVREVLPKLAPEVRLKVAGTIIHASERRMLDHPRVDYLGPRFGQELAALRRNALAVVVPNLTGGPETFEGFGLAATEAAAAGAVVIAARAHGIVDAVIEDVTGFLEAPGDAEAWAARIAIIATWTPAMRVGFVEQAKAAVAEHYSWDRVARETLDVYATGSIGEG